MNNHTNDTKAEFKTGEDSKFIDQRRTNVKSDLIEITEDKLENILLKHLQRLGLRKSWITPLSLLVTIILANLSATFGDKFGIKGTVWEAFFLLIAIVSGIWLVVSIMRMITSWKKSSLTNLIAIIKNAKDEGIRYRDRTPHH